jgi:hypothetical protein
MKASSNSGGFKNLLLQHIEKLVLGVAVVLVALFLWSAMGVQPLDASKQPEKLQAAANEQIQRIQTSTPPEGGLERNRNTAFEAAVVAGLEPVTAAAYVHPQPFAPPIQPPIVKRPEPTLYPVEYVRAVPTVVSVAEVAATPPVWTDPETVKTKAKRKDAPALEEQRGQRFRRGRAGYGGGAGYGDSAQAGYGAAARGGRGRVGYGGGSQPGYGGAGYGASGGGGADADRGGRAGYGGGSQPGYGAAGAKTGYGAAGGGRSGYGAAGGGGAGYGSAGGGYGGAGYGGAGAYAGMTGAKPGVDVTTTPAQGSVTPAVVITGRVPYQKQFDEFQKKFKEAAQSEMLSEQDLPTYMQIKVERQEVTPAGDAKWVELSLDEELKSEAQWIGASVEEVIDGAYFDQVLTWPLPPTILRDWGRLAGHPTIPFVWTEAVPTGPTGPAELTKEELEQMKAERMRTVQPQFNTGYGAGAQSPYGGAGAYGNQPMVAATPSYLFRFVDTQNLEPGKEYRYRVTLALQNPNFGLDPTILEEAASSGVESRWTPPAESSPVSIPGKSFLYALDAKVQGRTPGDYVGQLLYHIWNDKMGAEIAKEFELTIGGTADFISNVDNWFNPYTGLGEKLDNVHFAFKGGAPMLADVAGGEHVAGIRELDEPAQMLFVDAEGRMFTSNEARGKPASEFYKTRYVAEPDPNLTTEPTGPQPSPLQQGRGGSAPR